MFENTKTTRDQGDIGITAAVFHLSRLGYKPLLPVTDNNSYDLVIELNGRFSSVQVKTTKTKVNGNYQVQLRRIRPNRTKNVIHHFDKTEFDFLFVFTEEGDCYLIPSVEIDAKSGISLYRRYDEYKITGRTTVQ